MAGRSAVRQRGLQRGDHLQRGFGTGRQAARIHRGHVGAAFDGDHADQEVRALVVHVVRAEQLRAAGDLQTFDALERGADLGEHLVAPALHRRFGTARTLYANLLLFACLLAVIAARQLRDDTTVFAGVGVPLLAAALAKRRHAPRLTMVIEGGIIGPQIAPGRLPVSTNEMRAGHQATMLPGITDAFLFAQRGFVDVGFMGGALLVAVVLTLLLRQEPVARAAALKPAASH